MPTAECGEAVDSAGIASATLIASLRDEGASAAAVRRHLAALSELARDAAAASALQSQAAVGAIAAALTRHGASVAGPASALLAMLSVEAAHGDESDQDGEGS